MIGGLAPSDGVAMRDGGGEPWKRSVRVVPAENAERAAPPACKAIAEASQRNTLLRLLASGLDGVPRPEPWLDKELDWERLIAAASAGRLLTHVYHGAMISGIEAPQSLRDAARAFRGRALLVNSVNLSTIQRVGAALDRGRLPFVVIKGPLQLQALYGDYFVRASSDVDLLVHHHDYDRAAELLRELGYQAAERCETRWWRHYLGEQHLLAADATLATVDLHHRVQQPGCPAPRRPVSYIGDASSVPLGHAEVPVPSRSHGALLSAISFVKAVYHREHSMRYLCDLALFLRGMDEVELIALQRLAGIQGISNLLVFAWRSAAELLPVALPRPPRAQDTLLGRDVLAAMVLMPDSSTISWPKRRQLLWHLSDRSGIFGRPGNFAQEALFAAAAELSYRLTTRP